MDRYGPKHVETLQAWICAATRSFESRDEAVAALCINRHHYWCSVCDKPLVHCPLQGQEGDDVPYYSKLRPLPYSKFKIKSPSKFQSKSRVYGRCEHPKFVIVRFLYVVLFWYGVSVREFKLTFFIPLTSTVEGFNPAVHFRERWRPWRKWKN